MAINIQDDMLFTGYIFDGRSKREKVSNKASCKYLANLREEIWEGAFLSAARLQHICHILM